MAHPPNGAQRTKELRASAWTAVDVAVGEALAGDAAAEDRTRVEIPATWYTQFAKRAVDLIIAALLLVIVAPLLVIGALVVRLSIGRPVFIRQFRVGRGSRPFEMRRLRTKQASREVDVRDRTPRENDPTTGVRVSFNPTAATRRVQRWRVDVLPQLINVVRGDMSLVGPRPMTWQNAVSARLLDHPRHAIRPGLTGPAQLVGGHPTIEEELAMDCAYLETIGLRRDCTLLIATVVTVLRR